MHRVCQGARPGFFGLRPGFFGLRLGFFGLRPGFFGLRPGLFPCTSLRVRGRALPPPPAVGACSPPYPPHSIF